MIKRFRIWLARKILGNYCPCYQMGYHSMVDFQQRSADALKTHAERRPQTKSTNTVV